MSWRGGTCPTLPSSSSQMSLSKVNKPSDPLQTSFLLCRWHPKKLAVQVTCRWPCQKERLAAALFSPRVLELKFQSTTRLLSGATTSPQCPTDLLSLS